MACLTKIKMMQAVWIIGLALLMMNKAMAGFFDWAKDPLRIEPKADISLDYPSQWDHNKLIALSNDGSRLIDASANGRYIRVWDWQKDKVVQQLLLNEKVSEGGSTNPPILPVLHSYPGQELALSPDGRLLAACATTNKASTRVWNLESGAVVADIPNLQKNNLGLVPEMIFGLDCNSISFSPDNKHMAILDKDNSYSNNEAEFNSAMEVIKSYNISTKKYKNGMNAEEFRLQNYFPIDITGVALFNTSSWKLEQFFYQRTPRHNTLLFNSRPLFDINSKMVSTVVFDKAPPNPNWHSFDWEWAGNRIVRWDIATGVKLDEKAVPQLVWSPSYGVWWKSLPSGHEVWWSNRFNAISSLHGELSAFQTAADAEQCGKTPAPDPDFESDVIGNCGYLWSISVLNLNTGKLKYLAPFKKNLRTLTEIKKKYIAWASISPDGKHAVVLHLTTSFKNNLNANSRVEVINMQTHQLEGHYSADKAFDFRAPVFSSDSKYFAFVTSQSNDWALSALIFEMPKTNQ